MSSSHKHMIHQEVKILDEVVDVLLKPVKYGISNEELFEYLNKYTSNAEEESGSQGLELEQANSGATGATGATASRSVATAVSKEQEISTKMVDFKKVFELGRLLAQKDPMSLERIHRCLSTNVYINHLQTTTDFAPRSFNTPTMSPYYMPDLRLPIKNVLILFINYFKKLEAKLSTQQASIASDSSTGTIAKNATADDYVSTCESMRDLMLLLNVSIVNKLVTIFKTLNPDMRMKNESLMVNI